MKIKRNIRNKPNRLVEMNNARIIMHQIIPIPAVKKKKKKIIPIPHLFP